MMESMSLGIVVAGTGFPLLKSHLADALPGAAIVAIDPARLRAEGAAGEVLIPTMARIDGALMDAVAGLRLIQQWGAGLEGVDVEAATARRIAVANVPTPGTGNAESVAEWCVMAALALSRHLAEAERVIRAGAGWGVPMGQALLGRTAGIVGLGGIGTALAARLRPFGMQLAAVKRSPAPELAGRLGLAWLGGMNDVPELLARSDVLFLCTPVTAATRGMIDDHALALVRPGSIIVNPARGGLIDEGALLRALEDGRLGGAALDVFQEEPLSTSAALLRHPRVLATPHVAGVTDLSYRGIARRLAENARRAPAGGPYDHCVNAGPLGLGVSCSS
jgi:phosphoglycerate dehydrogenase-like enzyme